MLCSEGARVDRLRRSFLFALLCEALKFAKASHRYAVPFAVPLVAMQPERVVRMVGARRPGRVDKRVMEVLLHFLHHPVLVGCGIVMKLRLITNVLADDGIVAGPECGANVSQ